MDTTNKRWTQLYIFAAAALLIVAVAAVTLTAVPTQAQVIGGPGLPRTGVNTEEYSAPYPCSEEAQPDENTVSVIREGYYAVFDAFWDYEVGHLSDNFCPPKVTVTTDDEEETVYTRTDADIHISETAFSVPDSYKVTVVDSDATNGNPSTATGPKIDLADYPFLREAVSAVKPGPNNTTVFADNKVWWVRLDDPDTTGEGKDETSSLKIGFSTALMKDADWYLADGDDQDTDPDPPVQFHFGAVHVLEAGVPVETHVVGADFFAFEQKKAGEPLENAQWSNLETAAHSEINMAVGEYRPMQFLFTKPGEYLVQGQIQGHVRRVNPYEETDPKHSDWTPISPGESVTSPTEWYTFHVGPVADVGVTLTHSDETTDDDTTTVTDGTASFSVTATNSGSATATGVVVEVNLPVGLTYKANSARIGSATTAPASSVLSAECGVISWKIGDMAAPTGTTPTTSTLTFTADVDSGGPKFLTVDAEVHSSTVDENEANDTDSVVVKTNSTVVTPPMFPGVTRDIPEHAIAGTHAGDPVAAKNPDGRSLTYTLSGRCSGWFQVHSNGQIVLGAGRTLDYDKQSEFHLTLSVSDGVNASGGADTSADDSIPVTIRVIDTPDGAVHPTVTFTLSNEDRADYPNLDLDNPVVGSTVGIDPEVSNLPAGVQPNHFLWTNSLGGTEESWGSDGSVSAYVASAGAVNLHGAYHVAGRRHNRQQDHQLGCRLLAQG